MLRKNDCLQKVQKSYVRYILLAFLGLGVNLGLSGSLYAATELDRQALIKRLNLVGDFIQGGVIRGKVKPSSKDGIKQLKLNNEVVAISSNGYFVFGFGRDAEVQQAISFIKQGEKFKGVIEIATQQYNVQYINKLDEKKVTVAEKHLPRIYEEYRVAKVARRKHHDKEYFSQSFITPLSGIITGIFGSQRVLNGKPRRPHYGVDVAAPTGTPVRATADGIVALAHPGMFFSGATLIINHGYGLSTTFIHLDTIKVKFNQFVKQGQIVATVGATGRVTGAHLDWRMYWYLTPLDPTRILTPKAREIFLSSK